MAVPYGTSDTKPSYRMRKLLDSIWFSMEQMSTKPFADKQMEQEHYFQDFPRMAFYYFINMGFYHDRLIGSSSDLLQNPRYIHRLEQLYPWLAELRIRWEENKLLEKVKKNRPKIEALRQSVTIGVLGDLIEASIYPGNFSCDNSYIPLYLDARREFIDPKSINHVWERLHSVQKQQAELIYNVAIDSVHSSFLKYILEHCCEIEAPGEEAFFDKRDKEYYRNTREATVRYVFRNEIKIIEDGHHAVR
jgi:hypothetical protein